jgi:DNA adenine methylase
LTAPLLKWAGGKRQLLPALRRFYPSSFGRYFEPFLGSGAVFFDLSGAGRLAGNESVLIDSNPDLIGCYLMVRDRSEEVAVALGVLAEGHATGGPAHYYAVRDGQFNPEREARVTCGRAITYTPKLAAMLIYLNRTGFNGLFRVNAQGRFNVPAGRYLRPRIVDRQRLSAVASALSASGVRLQVGHYSTVLDLAQPGDFLYFDPPYAPVSTTANFTSYTSQGFDADAQEALQRAVVALARRGCYVVLSNSKTPLTRELYDGNAEVAAAGLRAYRVCARRAVNSNPSRRGPVDEYIITNVTASDGESARRRARS